MKSFDDGFLERQRPTHGLLSTVALVRDYRGREELFRQQSPQLLETLRRSSVVSSTESSNRIEGVVASRHRIEQLVAHKAEPRTRSEQEIAGYRDVLDTIHRNHEHVPITPNTVLQLHRDLFRFTQKPAGRWKNVENEIIEILPSGERRVRFRTVPAFQTPEAMQRLHDRFLYRREEGEVESLLLIAAYVLDFLCIHPFFDGNGRMARLLTLLLLYQAGFGLGRYISLEKVIEDSRESYYDSLGASSQGWHDGEHELLPWWEYFTGTMLRGYREFEQRVGETRAPRGAKRERVLQAVTELPEEFQFRQVQRACPGVSRPTIERALREMREAGLIRCVKAGREARWEKVAPS